jgi:hypothetical protein
MASSIGIGIMGRRNMRLRDKLEDGAFIVLTLLLMWGWFKPPTPKPTGDLPRGVVQQTTIDSRSKTIATTKRDPRTGVVTTKKATIGRHTTVTVKDDGTVFVKSRPYGLVFEPGMTAFVSDKGRLGLDAQVAYAGKWGVLVGAGTDSRVQTVDLYGAVGYNVYSNTSVFAGCSLRSRAVVGVRVEF